MKERLRAQLEALRTKLDPHIKKANAVWQRVGPNVYQKGKWILYMMILPVILVVFVVTGFFLVYPAHELRDWVSVKVQNQLNAQEVAIKDMRWDHSFLKLSLGVRLEGVDIKKGAWFDNIAAQKIRFSLSPLGLFVGGTPFDVEVEGLLTDARLRTSSKMNQAPEDASSKSRILTWTKSILEYAKGYRLQVKQGELRFLTEESLKSRDDDRFDFILRDIHLNANFSSSLTQELKLQALIQAGISNRWAVAGPVKLTTSSVLQLEGGTRPVSLNFSRFEADLSQVSMKGWSLLERMAGGVFEVSATPRVLFKEEKSELQIATVLFNDSRARIDDLEIVFSLSHVPDKESSLEWLLGRSEVSELRLPLRGLRRAPGKGIVSSSGRIVIRDRVDTSEATWRLMLNNFRIDSSHLSSIWGDKSSVKGELRLSAVSEGRMKDGKIESPRTEMQLDAADVSWLPPDSNLVKPLGHKAHVLLRVKHENEILRLEQLEVELHTLKFHVNGEATNVLNTLAANESSKVSLSFKSNNVDLSSWTALLPNFRKLPLQGFFETRGKLSTQLSFEDSAPKMTNTVWNIDKFQLSNIKGSVEDASSINVDGFHEEVVGPFEASVFFVGRGVGTRVDQARLLGKLDLTSAAVTFHKKFRKPQDVPFLLEISADQSRNRVNIERGGLKFADLDINFAGSMVQGQGRSRLNVKMSQPLNLSRWKTYVIDEKLRSALSGQIWVNGGFGLDSNFQSEKDIDWSTLTFEGDIHVQDLVWNSSLLGDFDSLSGLVRFQNDALYFSSFQMRKGPQVYKLDGSLRPSFAKAKGPRPLYVSHLFSSIGWDVSGNIEVPRVEASKLLKKVESIDRYTFLDSFMDGEVLKRSRASMNLSVGEVTWEAQPFLKSMLAKLEYQSGRWTMRPFSAVYGNSPFQASLSLDLNPVWQADQDPQWAASLRSKTFFSKDFPMDLGYEDAVLDIDLTLTSQGRYFLDWEKNLRVRGLIGVLKAKSSKWLKPIEEKVKFFFDESEARDYLLSDAKRDLCHPVFEKALMEVQWSEGALKLERMRQQNVGGGRLDLEALVTPKDQKSFVRGKAAFLFAKSCFSKEAQSCFDSLGGGRGWLLDFSKDSVSFADLKYDLDVARYAQLFKQCMAKKISERVTQEIKR